MTVKTYDIKGEVYATYTNIRGISKEAERFVLKDNNNESEKLSMQEVKMEVEQ